MSQTSAATPEHRATASLQLYVADVDATFQRAVQAGGNVTMPVSDMFWGDRMGCIADPFGQVWMISTKVKDLSQEQMRRAGEEFARKMQQQSAPPAVSGS
jgi:uncharacterized glyoxalase superfamily protein PhnB